MAGGASSTTTGKDRPATLGVTYGRQVFESTSDAERIFPLGLETNAIFIQANPDNSDNIYVGWDDEVTSNTGIVLEPGDFFGIGVNLDDQNVWGIPDTADDDVRFIAMR